VTDAGQLRAFVAVVAVVLAGCGGAVSLGDDGGTTPTADPPPRDAAPYRTLDPETVRAAHHAALVNRTNGTVVVRSPTVGGPGGLYGHLGRLSGSRVVERRTAYSLATGEQRRRLRAGDGSLVDDQFYANASRGYTRFRADGTSYYERATAYRNASELGAVADALRLLRFEGPTPTVWRGAPAYRYRASGPSAVRERDREHPSEAANGSVRNLTATVYVRPDGLVVHARTLVRTGGLRPDVRWNVTYTDLGETTVTRPPWADSARTRLERVSSVTTFERADRSLGVRATVTGGWENVTGTSYDFVPANGSLVDRSPIRLDRPGYVPDDGPVARSVVGPAAEVGVPVDRRSATVTLDYDGGAVATDERHVAVAAFGGDGVGVALLAPNRTSVDRRNDTVTAPLPPPEAFGGEDLRYHRRTYVAVDGRALATAPVAVYVPGRANGTTTRGGANATG
jgi:hypothetical protein